MDNLKKLKYLKEIDNFNQMGYESLRAYDINCSIEELMFECELLRHKHTKDVHRMCIQELLKNIKRCVKPSFIIFKDEYHDNQDNTKF